MAIQQLLELVRRFQLDLSVLYHSDKWFVEMLGPGFEVCTHGPDLDDVLQRCLDDVNFHLGPKGSTPAPWPPINQDRP